MRWSTATTSCPDTEMLSAGGSKSPEELGKLVGVDLADPSFWDNGLDLVAGQIEAAQTAADAVIAERGD